MTAAEFRACVHALGLTPRRPSYEGATLHEDRDGGFATIPDPETISAEERKDFLSLLKLRMGITDH